MTCDILSHALRAITRDIPVARPTGQLRCSRAAPGARSRFANVRFGILPPQSRLRGNDEQRKSWIPAFAGMTSKERAADAASNDEQ